MVSFLLFTIQGPHYFILSPKGNPLLWLFQWYMLVVLKKGELFNFKSIFKMRFSLETRYMSCKTNSFYFTVACFIVLYQNNLFGIIYNFCGIMQLETLKFPLYYCSVIWWFYTSHCGVVFCITQSLSEMLEICRSLTDERWSHVKITFFMSLLFQSSQRTSFCEEMSTPDA